MERKFRSFEEARRFVHSLKLQRVPDWKKYCKSGDKPNDIPSFPNEHYLNKGWKGYGDWLGTNSVATKEIVFLNFHDAREYIQSLNLKNRKEWEGFRKSSRKPDNIPTNPNRTYKEKGWKDINDWLGTGNQSRKEKHEQFLTYDGASDLVKKMNLKSETQWREVLKSKEKPPNIPSDPRAFYRNKGWTNWGDFLGTKNISVNDKKNFYLKFEDAKKFVSTLKLKNRADWRKFIKSNNFPKNIPRFPEQTYKNKGWVNLGDWLGNGALSSREKHVKFLSFREARMFVRKQKLKNQNEWRSFIKSGKLPKNISTVPEQTYKNKGWVNLGDWLGTGNVAPNLRKFRTFEEAKKFVHALGLKNANEWREFTKSGKLPKDIPVNPWRTYSKKGKK